MSVRSECSRIEITFSISRTVLIIYPPWRRSMRFCAKKAVAQTYESLVSDIETAKRVGFLGSPTGGKPNIRVASRKVASQRSSRSSGSFPICLVPRFGFKSTETSVRKNGKLPKDQGDPHHRTGRGFGVAVTWVWQIFALFAGHC